MRKISMAIVALTGILNISLVHAEYRAAWAAAGPRHVTKIHKVEHQRGMVQAGYAKQFNGAAATGDGARGARKVGNEPQAFQLRQAAAPDAAAEGIHRKALVFPAKERAVMYERTKKIGAGHHTSTGLPRAK